MTNYEEREVEIGVFFDAGITYEAAIQRVNEKLTTLRGLSLPDSPLEVTSYSGDCEQGDDPLQFTCAIFFHEGGLQYVERTKLDPFNSYQEVREAERDLSELARDPAKLVDQLKPYNPSNKWGSGSHPVVDVAPSVLGGLNRLIREYQAK